MEYQITFIIDGERKTLVLEHVKEEYGVSESDFWSCWILTQKHICGDGETPEQAIQAMVEQKESIELMRKAMAESFQKALVQFKTPIIKDIQPIKYDHMLSHAIAYGLVNIGR